MEVSRFIFALYPALSLRMGQRKKGSEKKVEGLIYVYNLANLNKKNALFVTPQN